MEHKVLTAETPINAEQLDDLAKDGYYLIEITQWKGTFYFYFSKAPIG